VNATGAAVDRLLAPLKPTGRQPMLGAMNLVTSRPAIAGTGVAVGGRTRSGRHLFTVPLRGRAVFGTWESRHAIDGQAMPLPDRQREEALEFIGAINDAFPSVGLTTSDVTLVHRGVVPARVDSSGHAFLEGREQIRTHDADNLSGLISVAGTKYTTARAVAERVVNTVFKKLERVPPPCRTAVRPLLPVPEQPPGDEAPAASSGGFEEDLQAHLLAAYGLRYDAVLNLCEGRPDWAARVSAGSPVIAAELVWAVRHEMALNLIDAVVRRTPLGALGDPGDAAIQRAADIVGGELAWTPSERERQLEDLRRFYRLRAL
jgi:glycerol-3-phosphate dehydrogenase